MYRMFTYIATITKKESANAAYKRAREDVEKTRNAPAPLHLRNAVTPLMRGLGYGKGYKYAHDYEGGYVEQQNLPDSLQGRRYYHPTEEGKEKEVKERMERGGGG